MSVKIMIDAGHMGGYNKPPNYPTYCEGDRMWKLSQYLVSELESYGFVVGQTKSSINEYPKKSDGSDDVYGRGQKSRGYDLMLSLHSNACGTESVNRAVIIHPMNGSQFGLSTKIGECVKTTMNVSSYQLLQRDYNTGDFISDGKSHEGYDWYGVIRGASTVKTPCIIIEHGFHTNNVVAKWLMSDDNLKKLAAAEAKVLADHFGVKKAATTGKLYRVQVGAFSVKSNAEAMLKKVKAAGFDGYITST